MKSYSSNQDFYDHIDEVVELLRTTTLSKSAKKIHYLLHEVAWATTSELFGELRNEFNFMLKGKSDITNEIREAIKHFVTTIDFASEIGADISNESRAVGSAIISNILEQSNLDSIESQGLAHGVKVRNKRNNREYIISSIKPDGLVYFKGGQGAKSWAGNLIKIEGYRDREEPHSSPLPGHAAYGSVLRGSADRAESDPGEHKSKGSRKNKFTFLTG